MFGSALRRVISVIPKTSKANESKNKRREEKDGSEISEATKRRQGIPRDSLTPFTLFLDSYLVTVTPALHGSQMDEVGWSWRS